MAAFYLDTDGTIGLRTGQRSQWVQQIPQVAQHVTEFDDSVTYNAQVVSDFNTGYSRFAFVDGVLHRDGVPVEFVAAPSPRTLTPIQFLDRVSLQTQVGVLAAAKTDPMVELIWTRLILAVEIDLDSQQTIGGVQYLLGAGVISQAEADLLLA